MGSEQTTSTCKKTKKTLCVRPHVLIYIKNIKVFNKKVI